MSDVDIDIIPEPAPEANIPPAGYYTPDTVEIGDHLLVRRGRGGMLLVVESITPTQVVGLSHNGKTVLSAFSKVIAPWSNDPAQNTLNARAFALRGS